MNAITWVGLALGVLGLLLIFSNVLGFIPGLPLLALGIVLILVGIVVALVTWPMRAVSRTGAPRNRV